MVIRGEIEVSCSIDWLTLVFPEATAPIDAGLAELRQLLPQLFEGLQDLAKGWRGYVRSFGTAAGVIVACGGNRDTWMVDIPGKACSLVSDRWPRVYEWLQHSTGHISRVDLAHDDHEGTRSVDAAVAMYKAGDFRVHYLGTNPTCRMAGDWVTGRGGRTFYVGKRTNGKMLCVYEKGKQLGDEDSPWVRWELRLGNRDRVIPLDVLVNPAPYFAGGYPALKFVTSGETYRIKTSRETVAIALPAMVASAKVAYGRLVNYLRQGGITSAAIAEELRRPGVPKRLSGPTVDQIIDACNDKVAAALAVVRAYACESFAYG